MAGLPAPEPPVDLTSFETFVPELLLDSDEDEDIESGDVSSMQSSSASATHPAYISPQSSNQIDLLGLDASALLSVFNLTPRENPGTRASSQRSSTRAPPPTPEPTPRKAPNPSTPRNSDLLDEVSLAFPAQTPQGTPAPLAPTLSTAESSPSTLGAQPGVELEAGASQNAGASYAESPRAVVGNRTARRTSLQPPPPPVDYPERLERIPEAIAGPVGLASMPPPPRSPTMKTSSVPTGSGSKTPLSLPTKSPAEEDPEHEVDENMSASILRMRHLIPDLQDPTPISPQEREQLVGLMPAPSPMDISEVERLHSEPISSITSGLIPPAST